MIKRRIAGALVAALNSCARLPGRRFYRFYLDELNRRFNDFGAASVQIEGQELSFVCPNRLTRWRVETLYEKEPETISWIDNFEDGAGFWDIGANIGIYSLYAAVKRGARVLAFEPAPANFALLAKNIEINTLGNRVGAFAIALGERRRIGTLDVIDTMPGSASSEFGDSRTEAGIKFGCLGYSIDDFIADFAPPFPQHLKIDVDGIEDAIILGARNTVADPRMRSVSIELDDRRNKGFVEASLTQAGYVCVGSFRSPLFPDLTARNFRFVRKSL